MARYIIRRLLQMIPLVIVISIISFGLFQLQPGDPIKSYVDRSLVNSAAAVERMREQMGLDQPKYVQYYRWMAKVAKGDLGHSYLTGDTVTEIMGRAIPKTLKLTITAFVIGFSLAIAIGVVSATRRYSVFDQATTIFSFAGIAVPNFWLGILLMLLFSVKLRWLPTSGMYTIGHEGEFVDGLKHMVMPVMVLAFSEIAGTSRYVRSSLLEVLRLDYIRTARSKGLSEKVVIYRHALRNALMPVVTFLGLGLAGFIGGALVIENMFGWPGMGRISVGAVFSKDYPVIMGTTMAFSLLTILGNLVADIMYAVVDPRVKFS